MCCRTNIDKIGPRAHEILTLAGFKQSTDGSRTWQRWTSGSQGVTVTLNEASIGINLFPGVGNMEGHTARRQEAALGFKLAAFLAEDAGAMVTQMSTASPCRDAGRPTSIIIADYPAHPLDWTAICPGFRAAMGGNENG